MNAASKMVIAPTVRLGSVISINPESIGNTCEYEDIRYIDISSVGSGTLDGVTRLKFSEAPSRARRLVRDGDTILSTVRPNRRSFLFMKSPSPDIVVSTGFAVLRPSEKIVPRFLYYTVTHQPFTDYLTNNAKGAAYPAVDADGIARGEIRLPPLPIQKKIGDVLSAYDDLIENNRRRITILESMARTIYREWFVSFRFPGHKKVKMVKSPRGLIPEGWRVVKLGDVVQLAYGKGLKASDRRDGDVPVYGSSGVVGFHDSAIVTGPGIIVGRKGNIGSVHWSDEDFCPIDTVFYVETELPLRYVFFNLQRQNFINNDAAVPGLNRNQAHSLSFLVPDSRILGQFETFVADVFAQVRNLGLANANLGKTRDLLLPRLISGQVDVGELAIDTEANGGAKP
ncbi:MAG: restriction endonuclease subunit S [Phycisphaeraceae bacterium]|nr:restriction endonuclease subunit S [Phycisphaeraceae bacterium]